MPEHWPEPTWGTCPSQSRWNRQSSIRTAESALAGSSWRRMWRRMRDLGRIGVGEGSGGRQTRPKTGPISPAGTWAGDWTEGWSPSTATGTASLGLRNRVTRPRRTRLTRAGSNPSWVVWVASRTDLLVKTSENSWLSEIRTFCPIFLCRKFLRGMVFGSRENQEGRKQVGRCSVVRHTVGWF